MSYKLKTSKVCVAVMLAVALASCESSTGIMPFEYDRLVVAPAMVTTPGWWGGEVECLQVRSPGTSSWTPFCNSIEGFVWEPGYFHEIEVRSMRLPNPPMDGSDRVYMLDRLVRKWVPGPIALDSGPQ